MSERLTRSAVPRSVAATAWVAGPVAVGLGFGAHVVSAAAPPIALVVALMALTSLFATLLVRLRLPLWALFLASAFVQQWLHVAFSIFGEFAGGTFLGHGHDGPVAVPASPGAPALGMHAAELLLYLHTAAALLTGVLVTGVAKSVAWWSERKAATRAR